MPQNTKIIATIGPVSESDEIISKLIKSGVNIFRFNLKHNSYEWHHNVVQRVRKIAKELNTPIGILADLQGPEIRTGVFPNNVEKVILTAKQKAVLCPTQPLTGEFFIPFNYLNEIKNLQIGHRIFIDDGKVELVVKKITPKAIYTEVENETELGNRKSVSIPDAHIDMPTLTNKDRVDAKFAIENKADFIALSFVRDGKDITTLRNLIKKNGGNQKIIAKIETLKSIHNFDEILKETDAIMFARGDLGIEISMEKLPMLQKQLIYKCRVSSKPSIVATQMLQSMIHSPLPTRAEVADIANAVFDKTDAIMLSEETTIGSYPVKTVQTMARIARYNEQHTLVEDIDKTPESYEEILVTASVKFIKQMPLDEQGVKGYIVFTESGRSARMLSRYRIPLPIYAFTTHQQVALQLTMSYGVIPHTFALGSDPLINIKKALETLRKQYLVEKGDKLLIIFGNNVGISNSNNNLTLVTA